MGQKGLLSQAILRFYPRKSAEELGLAPAQEVKLRKIQEGTTAIAAIGLGTIGMVGIGALSDGDATCMETDVAGTASQAVVQKSATGVLDSAAIPEMDSAVSASQLHPTTHSQDTITHPLLSLPPSSSSSLSQLSPPRTPQLNHGPHFHPTPRNLHPISRIWRSTSFRRAILTKIAEFSLEAKHRVTSR